MNLIEAVYDCNNLEKAFAGVVGALKGSQRSHLRDPDTLIRRLKRIEQEKDLIIRRIVDRRSIEPASFTRRVTKIPKKPGGDPERPISLFNFEERILLRALLAVIWPDLEQAIVPSVSFCTFRKEGIHPPRGIVEAVKTVGSERASGKHFIFETDIKSFFDRVDREKLLGLASSLLADDSVDHLLRAILYAETVYDERFEFDLDVGDYLGVPQGAALSPLLACVYLSPFDEQIQSSGFRMLRYVDDLVVIGTEGDCKRAEEEIRLRLKDGFGLDIHPSETKTKHVSPDESLVFLGHEISPIGRLRPSPKRRAVVAEHVFKTICGHKGQFAYVQGLPGANQQEVIGRLTSYLLGYFNGMGHCEWSEEDYAEVASYIRRALRSRKLEENRLSNGLRRASKKWPEGFLEAIR